MANTLSIPAKITPRLVEEMDGLIQEGWYTSRSEFIRDALREMVKRLKAERLEAAIREDVKWGLYGKD